MPSCRSISHPSAVRTFVLGVGRLGGAIFICAWVLLASVTPNCSMLRVACVRMRDCMNGPWKHAIVASRSCRCSVHLGNKQPVVSTHRSSQAEVQGVLRQASQRGCVEGHGLQGRPFGGRLPGMAGPWWHCPGCSRGQEVGRVGGQRNAGWCARGWPARGGSGRGRGGCVNSCGGLNKTVVAV